ncbi:MAG: hypothetical protein JJU05_14630 [Verrucomicrobia bacterium]|nr:hypothetical protein [Verrucomicrobiota bacterium]MCH8528324.1 hypothetical protein [Kiritimatiellia bacterium]
MKHKLRPSAQRSAALCAAAGFCLGAVAFCGWMFDVPALKSVFPGMVTMKANTSIGIMVCGWGFWRLRFGDQRKNVSGIALVCGVFTLLLGVLTLLQYAWDADFGIDQLVFREAGDVVLTQTPGRMALNTALAFCAAGAGLAAFFQPFKRPLATVWVVVPSATLLLSAAMLALTGYLLRSTPGYQWGDATAMAVHTAVAFLLLGVSMIARLQERKLLEWSLRYRIWIPMLSATMLLLAVNVQGWNAVSQMWDSFQALEDVNENRREIQYRIHALSLVSPPDLYSVATERSRLDTLYQQSAMEAEVLSRQSRETARYTFFMLPAGGTAGLVILTGVLILLNRENVYRSRAEARLSEAVAELKRSNQELEQFAYVASHDLQEPLRMISSYLQLIEARYADKLDQDGHEFIGYAVDGAVRMRNLINDLLTLSRIRAREKPFEAVEMNKVMEEVLQDLRLKVEALDAEIQVEALPVVQGDPVQLSLLMRNLLSNALKFHGKDPVRIRVGVRRRGGVWEFLVQDNGVGIAREHFERIFVIFQRLHARDAFPGTGIGLAICRRVVERHGGSIRVESVPEHGSTFYFTLPSKPGTMSQ